MMANANGVKTNFVYGESYDVSKEEAKIYNYRKWTCTPEDAKKENIQPKKKRESRNRKP